jgi:phosphoribosyl 1,2-cyclic phosphodiesterase
MQTFSCQSGSNGNCIFVQAGRTRILVDAGISGKQARLRMAEAGQDIGRVDALLISHDHHDHVTSAGVYQRAFSLPIWATAGTMQACAGRLGDLHDVRTFRPGDSFQIGEAVVHTFPTPHDGVDGVCFVIEHQGKRLGILTDLGFVFPELEEILPGLDGAFLESNYDPRMLRDGPYPAALQARIRGDGGHLSNEEAACLLRDFSDGRLKWAALAHLSQHNNTPELALAAARHAVRRGLTLHVASRFGPSEVFQV